MQAKQAEAAAEAKRRADEAAAVKRAADEARRAAYVYSNRQFDCLACLSFSSFFHCLVIFFGLELSLCC